jgi:hypothetical protein
MKRNKTKNIGEEEHFKIRVSAAEAAFPVPVLELFVVINKIIFHRSHAFRNISICIKALCH